MDLLEHQGKALLADAGMRVPVGRVVTDPGAAAAVADELNGAAVCKAQVPSGKRGKAGAVKLVATVAEARSAVQDLLDMTVAGHPVASVLVEQQVDIARECYAAVLDDPGSGGPVLLFSDEGGMDVEELAAHDAEALQRLAFDVRHPPSPDVLRALAASTRTPLPTGAVADALATIIDCYLACDATLVEVNPLVVTGTDDVMALDAKVTVDDAALPRQRERLVSLVGELPMPGGTELERRGRDLGLSYIELDGDVGILANGAGLTMTTLDVVTHYGGRPANFLEIGGDAYTKATPALELVLSNPNVRCVLVNFCGAFARTDVMTAGVLDAIDSLRPEIPIYFTVHGTGEAEAIEMINHRREQPPFDVMDDAVRAAVAAAEREDA